MAPFPFQNALFHYILVLPFFQLAVKYSPQRPTSQVISVTFFLRKFEIE